MGGLDAEDVLKEYILLVEPKILVRFYMRWSHLTFSFLLKLIDNYADMAARARPKLQFLLTNLKI